MAMCCIAVVVLGTVHCGERKPAGEETLYRNLSDSARYVGIASCRQCHQSMYESFIQTGMGQSFAAATREKSAGRFGAHDQVYDAVRDFYYRPFWDKDTLKLSEFRLKGKDTVYKRVERIDYIIGSGQHTNSHMYLRNGYLFQAPITFYTQKKEWDLPPGFENGANPRFSRQIGLECMTCHNSYPRYVQGSENKYHEIPQGIDCERCHGPGSIHVKEKMAGKLVDITRETDYSIVNPAKLPVDLQFEICQRCHLQGNAVLKEGKSFYDFRPGMHLSEVMDVFVPRVKEKESEYIMASHVERLKMSPCFTATMEKVRQGTIPVTDKLKPYKDAMTCVTCHNPHVSVKVTGKEVYNNACRKCHNGAGNRVCSRPGADKGTNEPLTGDCVSCHMKKSGTIDIPHVVTTDHYIRRPVDAKELKKVKDFLGLICVNNKKPGKTAIAKGFMQYYERFDEVPAALDSAAYYVSGASTEEIRKSFENLVYLSFLKKEYQQVVNYAIQASFRDSLSRHTKSWDNRDAWLSFRVGSSYYRLGQVDEALHYIDHAVRLSPWNLEFRNEQGALLMILRRYDEAIKVFSGILRENPDHAQALSNLGFTYLVSAGATDKAMECYNKALQADPDYEQGLLNKAGLLIYLKNYAEARRLLGHLLQKHPFNAQAKEIMASLNELE
jgi:Flp pilus assembly protein TadD